MKAIKMNNCLNLGNVTVAPPSVIGGSVNIRTVYTANSNSAGAEEQYGGGL